MDILIPTYGRHHSQSTWQALAKAGLDKRARLVVQDREKHLYAGLPTVVLPPAITTIAPTRQWILDHVGNDERIVMLDDDLTFYRRRDDDPTKFVDATAEDMVALFMLLEDALRTHQHAGVAPREGANRVTAPYIHNTRIMRVLGYRRDALRAYNIRFDTMEVMEDFDVALWLLRYGCANVLVNLFCQNQAGSGKAGGCSHFRTPELHARNAARLQERHPAYVRLVQKSTKGAWGGGTRTDVVIQWKKAYDDGRKGI